MKISASYRSAHGYPTVEPIDGAFRTAATTAEYAAEQVAYQPIKAQRYLIPILEQCRARIVVDVGCGVGEMVETLLTAGYDAYGVDLIEAEPLWAKAGADGRARDRFIVVDPDSFRMPFLDNSVDFIFSFGVIEHVGTFDGHSDRRADYKAIRGQWARELLRTLKVGGNALIGGPNRTFPVDAAHGPDCRTSALERQLYNMTNLSIHRIWGDHFLWSYSDLARHLEGLPCQIEPRSIDGFIDFSRVPGPLKPLVRGWVKHMPKALLGTGFNPWMMALVTKTA